MKSLRAIANRAASAIAASILLLTWPAAVESGERETKLLAADGAPIDLFGSSVAIFADTAVVGAEGVNSYSGAAYVFTRDPLDPIVWTQTAKLTAADATADDRFGTSVAIFGDAAVIAANLDDDLGTDSGSVYVFERDPLDPKVWTQTAKLLAADGAAGDTFGSSVAIFGDTAVIGAANDDGAGFRSGSSYIFERDPLDPADWTQAVKLTAADGAAYDFFGLSVAIGEDTAVIGAYGDDGFGYQSGAAYVFERDSNGPPVWTQTANLLAADGAAGDEFGVSVAISGDIAVIGASRDDALGVDSGSAYIFERDPIDPADWTQTVKLTAADGWAYDAFGASVAIAGDTAVIGADEDDVNTGSAYLFARDPLDPRDWRQIAKFARTDGAFFDYFGRFVAISRGTAVVGAHLDDDLGKASGSAYVYSLQGCELALALEPLTLHAGEELRVAVDLHHRRPITVTVPFLLWIEDAAGHVVAQRNSPPITMEPGDHRQMRMAVTLPQRMPAGTYQVLVGVRRMQQGIAWASRRFQVVE